MNTRDWATRSVEDMGAKWAVRGGKEQAARVVKKKGGRGAGRWKVQHWHSQTITRGSNSLHLGRFAVVVFSLNLASPLLVALQLLEQVLSSPGPSPNMFLLWLQLKNKISAFSDLFWAVILLLDLLNSEHMEGLLSSDHNQSKQVDGNHLAED